MLGVFAIALSASARRVGAYCYFANTGSELYEDANVKVVLAMEKNEMKLAIYNKTDQVIYVDKANTFAYTNGTPEMLFKNTAQTTSNTSSGGASLNLGGVAGALGIGGVAGGILGGMTLGGGNSTQTGTIVYEQRVIPVAPKSISLLYSWKHPRDYFIKELTQYADRARGKGSGSKRIRFIDPLTGYKEKPDFGTVKSFTETLTPFSARGVVKYATDENFESATQATVSNYVSDIVIDSYKGVKNPYYSLPYCMQAKNRRADYAFVSGPGWAQSTGGIVALSCAGLSVYVGGLYWAIASSV